MVFKNTGVLDKTIISNKNKLLAEARTEGLLFSSMELEYKKKSSNLYIRGDGKRDLSLTNSYYAGLDKQIEDLKISNLDTNVKSNLNLEERDEFEPTMDNLFKERERV